jgi:hypothetical protein
MTLRSYGMLCATARPSLANIKRNAAIPSRNNPMCQSGPLAHKHYASVGEHWLDG